MKVQSWESRLSSVGTEHQPVVKPRDRDGSYSIINELQLLESYVLFLYKNIIEPKPQALVSKASDRASQSTESACKAVIW